ncbi:MAG: LysR family hydrogen peroxide-inducible transcriptional activator [Gammaproteobacteria bacterium]|jgi:LysR family hydrogen peroxide-inducible transcriptional activator
MTAIPSIKQLRYLLAVVEHLNFTRAAQSCFVTQSTLSTGLKELEKVLGVKLVERDRQTVLITPTGLEVARRSRTIVAEVLDLVEHVVGAITPMSGLLRLGVIPTIAPFVLPEAMKLLRKDYPELRVALREDLTENLLVRLEDGRIDFALIALPYATDQFHVESLFDDDLCVLGLKGDAAIEGPRITVTPSITDRLLLLEEGHCLREHTLVACGAANKSSSTAVEATSLLTLVQMIESGFGIGLVPAMAIKSGLAKNPQLVSRRIAKPGPKRTIALAARRSSSRMDDFQALTAILTRCNPTSGQESRA